MHRALFLAALLAAAPAFLTAQGIAPDGSVPGGPAAAVPPQMLQSIRYLTWHTNIGADLQVAAKVACSDAQTAENMRKMIDGATAMFSQNDELPPEARELLNSLKVSNTGNSLSATLVVSESMLDSLTDQLIQMARMQMPPGMGQ